MSRDILVLRALGIGDLLTSVPALRGLRRSHPDARITLAAPHWLAGLVARLDAVDRLLPTEGLVPLDWRDPPPWLAVNLHGRGPRSTELLAALLPARLIAHGRDVPWRDDLHEVHRWCRLLAHHGIDADPTDLALRRPVIVHPGASHPARRWPAERYAEVVWSLSDAGEDVVVTGSAAERDLVHQVAGIRGCPHVGGPLTQLADLVARARLVVCGDTGMAHLASAYGTPSVVLFGPVSPARWGPPPGPHQVLWAGTTGDTFADEPDPGLLRITVADVLDAVGGGSRWTHVGSVSSERVTWV